MRLSTDGRGQAYLYGSFAVALLLNTLPMPSWAETIRPDWVALTLIYWCIALPHRISVGTGWTLGLLLDLLYGSLLGQHALAKSVVAFIAVRLHPQLRMFPRWQQAVSVLVLLVIDLLVVAWIRGAIGKGPGTVAYWVPGAFGALIWPIAFVILRDLRRRGGVA